MTNRNSRLDVCGYGAVQNEVEKGRRKVHHGGERGGHESKIKGRYEAKAGRGKNAFHPHGTAC